MATGKIEKPFHPCGSWDIEIMSSSTARTTSTSSRAKQKTIGRGLYLLIGTTTADNYTGRAYCYFTGTGVLGRSGNFPPTLVKQYHNSENIQVVFVETSVTLDLMYWDSNTTGAEHQWKIIKIME